SMAAEYYRPVRASYAVAGAAGASDHHCGPNGFDLPSLSGNRCRCTGYRPIRDAAYALGQPGADDAIAARREQPAPASAATDLHRVDTAGGEFGRYRRPATLTEA